MTVHQESSQLGHPLQADCPAPVSLETIAVVEQLLAGMLRELRQRFAPQSTAQAGAIEYASWLRGARD